MYEFRDSPLTDAHERRKVFALLDAIFPGIARTTEAMDRYGCPWHECSMPFVCWSEGMPVAHVGVLEIPLVVQGQEMTVAGLHAVCTDPEHRRRGLARQLLERALSYVDGKFAASLLFADDPRIYEGHGFRVAPQSRFACDLDLMPQGAESGGELSADGGFRRADLASDDARFAELLERRVPVSRRLGSLRSDYLAHANLELGGLVDALWYCDELDAFAVFARQDCALMLFDVIARRLPAIDELVARIDPAIRVLRFGFTPELFVPQAKLTIEELPDDTLMLRGDWPDFDRPIRFPYLAHC